MRDEGVPPPWTCLTQAKESGCPRPDTHATCSRAKKNGHPGMGWPFRKTEESAGLATTATNHHKAHD